MKEIAEGIIFIMAVLVVVAIAIASISAFPCEICGDNGHSTTSHIADDIRKEANDD